MGRKFYAVRTGKTPGIYMDWEDCRRMVEGYPGAVYKGFQTIEEAAAYLGISPEEAAAESDCSGALSQQTDEMPSQYAFVDGSFCVSTGIYGYGGFLIGPGGKYILQGCGDDEEMASMRNVAGEILGSRAAIEKALELGWKELTVFYDYLGIEKWADGSWKRNKAGTAAYYEFIQSVRTRIDLKFVKVKGHSGIRGNEEADRLAKEAVGIAGKGQE